MRLRPMAFKPVGSLGSGGAVGGGVARGLAVDAALPRIGALAPHTPHAPSRDNHVHTAKRRTPRRKGCSVDIEAADVDLPEAYSVVTAADCDFGVETDDQW